MIEKLISGFLSVDIGLEIVKFPELIFDECGTVLYTVPQPNIPVFCLFVLILFYRISRPLQLAFAAVEPKRGK